MGTQWGRRGCCWSDCYSRGLILLIWNLGERHGVIGELVVGLKASSFWGGGLRAGGVRLGRGFGPEP